VNTLNLILSDDDVAERTSILDDEDSVRVATLILTSAGNAAAVSLHSAIEVGDLHGLGQSFAALGRRDGERSALREGEEVHRS